MSESDWISLTAPVSGTLVPLEQVPDAVFAAGMVGRGVAIDPTSQQLLSPCDGIVAAVHDSGHALTLLHPRNFEVMLHIGLETVLLQGEGFRPRIQAGQAVRAGDVLVQFDADSISQRARSLLTLVLIPHAERVAEVEVGQGPMTGGEAVVMRVRLQDSGVATVPLPADDEVGAVSRQVVVPLTAGLHARPAAVVAALARRFAGRVELVRGVATANAKSVVALMTLQVRTGESVVVRAWGAGADDAVDALVAALASGLGEELYVVEPVPPSASLMGAPLEPGVFQGLPASPGLVIGPVFQWRRPRRDLTPAGLSPDVEHRRLRRALEQARGELQALVGRLAVESGATRAAVFAAQREMLDDPDLGAAVRGAMDAGKSAAYAWHAACAAQAGRLAALAEPRLAARAIDVEDLCERVLRALLGEAMAPLAVPPGSILVAEDLTPSETTGLDREQVVGLATLFGGTSSHAAILARALELPAVVALDSAAAGLPQGVIAILDGTHGTLRVQASKVDVAPTPGPPAEVRAAPFPPALQLSPDMETLTRDGHAVRVHVNLSHTAEAEQAVRMGAGGVGLLRSQLLFSGRSEAPTEEEQFEAYAGVARALGPQRRLLVSTLDVGGRAPAWLALPPQENPALGIRGVRLSLERPDLFRTQIRALLRTAWMTRLGIMLPMVSGLAEYREARHVFEEERQRLQAPDVHLGILVEVPAVALTAEKLAQEADFFSLGTNELTMYALAVDRAHPRLAAMADGLHPAVLRLIHQTVQGAARYGRRVDVCGGLAGDVRAIPILLGLGVSALSVAVPGLPWVKAAIRELELARCQELAQQALRLESAAQVRALGV